MAPNSVATPRPVMASAAVGGAAPVTRKKTAARASPPQIGSSGRQLQSVWWGPVWSKGSPMFYKSKSSCVKLQTLASNNNKKWSAVTASWQRHTTYHRVCIENFKSFFFVVHFLQKIIKSSFLWLPYMRWKNLAISSKFVLSKYMGWYSYVPHFQFLVGYCSWNSFWSMWVLFKEKQLVRDRQR